MATTQQPRPSLLQLFAALFPDNTDEEIDPADLRDGLIALVNSALILDSDTLSVNKQRGGTHLKTTLAQRDAILTKLLAVGMKCFVATPSPGATYELVRDSAGPLLAYQDGDSTTQVKARWVEVVMPEQNAAAGIEPFDPQSPTAYHASNATGPASLVSFILPSGPNVRFFTALKTMSYSPGGAVIPAPTGEANDTNWREASPPAASWVPYQEISYQALFNLWQDSKMVPRRTYGIYDRKNSGLIAYVEFDEADSTLAFAARQQNSDELWIYNISTDTLTPLGVVEASVGFPASGLQSAPVQVIQPRYVGQWSFYTQTNVANLGFKKNGVGVDNSFPVALNDVVTVTGNAGAGGGVVVFNVAP